MLLQMKSQILQYNYSYSINQGWTYVVMATKVFALYFMLFILSLQQGT